MNSSCSWKVEELWGEKLGGNSFHRQIGVIIALAGEVNGVEINSCEANVGDSKSGASLGGKGGKNSSEI